MDAVRRFKLVKRYCDEVITEEELKILLETNSSPKAYWGFECSGQ